MADEGFERQQGVGDTSAWETAKNAFSSTFEGIVNSSDGTTSSSSTWADLAPEWATNVGSDAKNLLANPTKYIFGRITEYILGVIFGTVFGLAALIQGIIGRITSIIGYSGGKLTEPLGEAGRYILGAVDGFNQTIALAVTDYLGIAAPFVIIPLYAVEIALIIRAIPPLLAALTDAMGSIPVIGSLLGAASTFAQEYLDLEEWIGGTD